MREVVVRSGGPEVARDAAERIVESAGKAIAERGRFTLALAGGSSPRALYELLASAEFSPRINWAATLVFFGDERCVPPEHEWSNYGMARAALLNHVPLAPENIHPILAENGPDNAAAEYSATLARVFAPDQGQPPRFDLILLGMGDDGHTASLFPGMPALEEREAWVAGTSVPGYVRPQVPRVTLTLPVLNGARGILFLVTGKEKAARVRQALREASTAPGGAPAGDGLPAARVQPKDGALTWLLDSAAGSLLGMG